MTAPSSRLRWKCRRGMREMDILLARFLDRAYGDLDQAQQSAFERLLDLPDQDLLAWLSGSGAPDDVELRPLLEHIRQVVQAP